jgi:2-polyprenyl-6-methoxyphenol hydroxylase-like FAD-dependent oxidoreductase
VELSRAGHHVEIYERSATELVDQGAGVIAPAHVFQQMIARKLLPESLPRCQVATARYVCRQGDDYTGRWLGDAAFPLTTVNWAHLHRHLRSQVPSAAYHSGVAVHRAAEDDAAGSVSLETSKGRYGPFDLVVFADGYRSAGRSAMGQGSVMRYLGLVFWRGLLSGQDAGDSGPDGVITRIAYPGGHGALYSIPGDDKSPGPGDRTTMWGYYLPAPADALGELLTDARGQRHAGSVALGQVRPDVGQDFHKRLAALIPPQYLDLIDRTTRTSIQAVFSAQAPGYARGRLCVIGDAGTVFPPFSGSGVLKAISNATTLSGSLTAAATIDEALSAWNDQQRGIEQAMAAVAERNGRNLVYEVPDLASMDDSQIRRWLADIHPDADITTPGLPA